MKNILFILDSEISRLKSELREYKQLYDQYLTLHKNSEKKKAELEMNLNAANAIIEELREQLNNK